MYINSSEPILSVNDIMTQNDSGSGFNPLSLVRINTDYITYEVTAVVPYIDAEDANFYPIFYSSNVKCFLIEARERHTTAASNATLTVEKLPNGTTRPAGTSMLASYFNLSAAANTTQLSGPTTTLAGIQLNPGDAMALRVKGTLTSLRNVVVTVLLGINMSNIPNGQSASTIVSGL